MHLCIAGSVRAMPEKEKPPAMPVDIYCYNSTVYGFAAENGWQQFPNRFPGSGYDFIMGIAVGGVPGPDHQDGGGFKNDGRGQHSGF